MEQVAARYPASRVDEQDVKRRAVEAAIWGIPIVSLGAMRQTFFRDAGATYGDIAFWTQPSEAKFPFTAPEATARYAYTHFNTRQGPVVIEVPAATGARVAGGIADAWQWEIAAVGTDGWDRGAGARYVVLPPGYTGAVPAGCIAVLSNTYNGYALVRVIPVSPAAHHVAAAIDVVHRMRVVPLAQAAASTGQRHIDLTSNPLGGRLPCDATFFEDLARMVDEEPVRDLVAIGHLRSLGIRTGQSFRPDRLTRDMLATAAAEAHTAFMRTAMKGHPWWPERRFTLSVTAGPRTGFSYLTGDRLQPDERAILFFIGNAEPLSARTTTSFTGAFRNGPGDHPHLGDASVRFPARRRYWAAAVHGSEAAWFIRDCPRLSPDRKVTFIRFYTPHRTASGAPI